MRLFCNVLKNRLALGHRCRHHDIDGCSDGNHIKVDMACDKIDRVGYNCSADDLHIGSQGTETL